MDAKRRGGARASWWSTLLALVALGLLVLAVPAAAQDDDGQEANISQSCNAGSDGGDSGDGSDGSSGSDGSDGGSCSNQRRVVQQSAGGDTSRSINQRQSVGGNDEGDDGENRVRARRDRDEDRARSQDDSDSEETPASAEVSSDELDCSDFESQSDAQDVLDEDSSDPNGLDGDDDDRACEDEFSQAVSGAPEGGVETGGGGTLARAETDAGSSALADVARVAGPPLALALIVAGFLGLRRGRTA